MKTRPHCSACGKYLFIKPKYWSNFSAIKPKSTQADWPASRRRHECAGRLDYTFAWSTFGPGCRRLHDLSPIDWVEWLAGQSARQRPTFSGGHQSESIGCSRDDGCARASPIIRALAAAGSGLALGQGDSAAPSCWLLRPQHLSRSLGRRRRRRRRRRCRRRRARKPARPAKSRALKESIGRLFD